MVPVLGLALAQELGLALALAQDLALGLVPALARALAMAQVLVQALLVSLGCRHVGKQSSSRCGLCRGSTKE